MSRISRFDFLRGDFSGRRAPIRPPWAQPESLFTEKCTRCDECIAACSERIIIKGRGGFPTINFKAGECTFCGDCVVSCKDGALLCPDGGFDDTTAWSIKAAIQSNCLALKGVECRVCGEHCESAAIRFKFTIGMVATPELNPELCNGCGACLAVCPVDAVAIVETETVEYAPTSSTDNGLATAI